MSKKPLSKTEIKARKAEASAQTRKKRDFRQFANKMFKNPTDHLPLISHGFGAGESAYCYNCKSIAPKITIKEGGLIICRTCQNTDVEMRAKDATLLDKIKWRYKEFIYGRQHKK